MTGFHLESYPVCVVCKEEISESLKKQIDSKDYVSKKDIDDGWWNT